MQTVRGQVSLGSQQNFRCSLLPGQQSCATDSYFTVLLVEQTNLVGFFQLFFFLFGWFMFVFLYVFVFLLYLTSHGIIASLLKAH